MDFSTALFSPESARDPYPLLARLRSEAPVLRLERYGWWAVSRYEDVATVFKRHDLFSSQTGFELMRPPHLDDQTWKELEIVRGRSMINSDPPTHTRLRRLVSAAFTPRAMTQLEARIQQIARTLVDDLVARDGFDVLPDLAIPLPVTVIAEMLGIDPARGADFKRWSDDLIELSRLTREQRMSPEQTHALVASRHELVDYLQATIAARREQPRDDLLSQLARAEGEDAGLTAQEVLGMAVLLLIAGNETTTNLIATGTHLLLDHPEALAALRADLSLIPNFIEEVLRHQGPVMMLFRRTTADVELSGVTVPRGELVLALIGAANRDPAHFPDPDRFDIRRDTRGHLGFGHGIHFCVGAPLSRLEGRIAFTELLTRSPAFARVDPRPAWGDNPNLRGLHSLPVRFVR
jgi:cytochrome P450